MATMKLNKTKCYAGVRSNGTKIGLLAIGTLELDGKSYSFISGPWSKGVLPNGKYTVMKYRVVATATSKGFKSASGSGWFIPLKAPANVKRSGFGIHPDGNVEGTQGCIGIVGADADSFWKAWLDLSMKKRPEELDVSGATESSGEYNITGEGKAE